MRSTSSILVWDKLRRSSDVPARSSQWMTLSLRDAGPSVHRSSTSLTFIASTFVSALGMSRSCPAMRSEDHRDAHYPCGSGRVFLLSMNARIPGGGRWRGGRRHPAVDGRAGPVLALPQVRHPCRPKSHMSDRMRRSPRLDHVRFVSTIVKCPAHGFALLLCCPFA